MGMYRARSHPVVHLELHTRDRALAAEKLERICGWRPEEISAAGGTYQALALGGGLGGGIVECRPQRPLWLPYAEVSDIREATEQARANGARVVMGPREGSAGWRAMVAVPAGGEIAFWQPKR